MANTDPMDPFTAAGPRDEAPPAQPADLDFAGVTWHDDFTRCPECGNATVGLRRPWAINHRAECSLPIPSTAASPNRDTTVHYFDGPDGLIAVEVDVDEEPRRLTVDEVAILAEASLNASRERRELDAAVRRIERVLLAVALILAAAGLAAFAATLTLTL